MASFPEELIEEILSILPVKSLLRFKTVSKKWYSLFFKDHKFQLKQSSSALSKNLILYRSPLHSYGSYAIFQCSDVDSINASPKIKFPVEIGRPYRVIGSANGLICVAFYYEKDCCYIWNPCTHEFKTISVPVQLSSDRLFGFGYDSVSDDYKLVGNWDLQIGIFSLKTNSWKILEYSSKYVARAGMTAFYSNGSLNWCIGPEIIAFDLAKEQIFLLDVPEEISWDVHLFDYQGSLCASGNKSIWVMKEYGNSKSWAKLTTPLPHEYAKPVYISRRGELVFCVGARCVKSDIQGRMSDEDNLLIQNYVDSFV